MSVDYIDYNRIEADLTPSYGLWFADTGPFLGYTDEGWKMLMRHFSGSKLYGQIPRVGDQINLTVPVEMKNQHTVWFVTDVIHSFDYEAKNTLRTGGNVRRPNSQITVCVSSKPKEKNGG